MRKRRPLPTLLAAMIRVIAEIEWPKAREAEKKKPGEDKKLGEAASDDALRLDQ
jgi:hypothetical protein